jgi:hypothetical protein
MKYALILILAGLPLLALTGWSFVQALDSDAALDAAAQRGRPGVAAFGRGAYFDHEISGRGARERRR